MRGLHGHVVHDVAVGPHAGAGQEHHVGAHLGEGVLGERADQRPVVAAVHAAEQDQPDGVVVAELVEDGEARGDDGEVAAAQVLGQHRGGGADVEQHHAAVGHRPGGRPADPLLLRGVRAEREGCRVTTTPAATGPSSTSPPPDAAHAA